MAKKSKEEKKEKNKIMTTNEEIINDICLNIPDAQIIQTENALGYISTGNLAIDFICSGKFWDGGIPMGRITEIYGSSSTGKTVVGTHIIQCVQKMGGVGILIDSESAYSASFGETLGLDISKLVYIQPECLEDCFTRIVQIVQHIRDNTSDMRPIAIVYDSIAASPSRREITKVQAGEDIGSSMGHRALICSDYLRNIASFLAKQKAAVIVINQVREKIGVLFGSNETTAGGGRSLEFYCSLRLNCKNRGRIIDKQKRVIGIEMDVGNTKNKCSRPFRIASGLELFFDQGINPTSGLIKLLVEEEKITQSGAWYTINDGSETKFQSKNFTSVLIEHPELVGAPSREELEKFIGINRQSLEASLAEDIAIESENDDN